MDTQLISKPIDYDKFWRGFYWVFAWAYAIASMFLSWMHVGDPSHTMLVAIFFAIVAKRCGSS